MADLNDTILVLPSGAALIWPPRECPDCKRQVCFVACTATGTKCVFCAGKP